MESLKPLVTIAVLGGIGYVVYTQLNSKPSAPPPGVAQGWDKAPTVQMPGDNSGAGKWNGGATSNGFLTPPAAIGGGANASNTNGAPSFPGVPSLNTNGTATAPANYGGGPGATPNANAGDAAPWGTTDPAAAVSVATGGAPATSNVAPANYGSAVPAEPSISPPTGANPSVNAYSASASSAAAQQFQTDWVAGTQVLEEGKLAEGLAMLSRWYDHPQLTATEQQQITELLDQVAGTVIYSTQNTLEPPHTVRPGERMEDIGQQYNVPWQLLAKINGIDDPMALKPGEQLKVIRGPFGALISMEKHQLTLMLGEMYAGRFAIGIGRDTPPHEGNFTVTEKVNNPTFHGRNRTIEPGDPNNPLGTRLISLGQGIGLHGTGPLVDLGSANQPGSISLGPRDIEDVFDILSVGSKVVIVK